MGQGYPAAGGGAAAGLARLQSRGRRSVARDRDHVRRVRRRESRLPLDAALQDS